MGKTGLLWWMLKTIRFWRDVPFFCHSPCVVICGCRVTNAKPASLCGSVPTHSVQSSWTGMSMAAMANGLLTWTHSKFALLGYGSIPIDTFLVGWTSIYQLFWGSLGTRVLTHPHLLVIKHSRLKHPPDEIRGAIHVIAITCTDPQRHNGVRASESPLSVQMQRCVLQLILFFCIYTYNYII